MILSDLAPAHYPLATESVTFGGDLGSLFFSEQRSDEATRRRRSPQDLGRDQNPNLRLHLHRLLLPGQAMVQVRRLPAAHLLLLVRLPRRGRSAASSLGRPLPESRQALQPFCPYYAGLRAISTAALCTYATLLPHHRGNHRFSSPSAAHSSSSATTDHEVRNR